MKRPRILIIDDEKEFVDTLSLRLKALKYEILEAYSGEDGLKKVIEEKPDLVILDIAMPEMDGFVVLEKIKVNKLLRSIPVIMLSAKFQPNDLQFAKELGSDAYLTKPVDFRALSMQVDGFLQRRKAAPSRAQKKESSSPSNPKNSGMASKNL